MLWRVGSTQYVGPLEWVLESTAQSLRPGQSSVHHSQLIPEQKITVIKKKSTQQPSNGSWSKSPVDYTETRCTLTAESQTPAPCFHGSGQNTGCGEVDCSLALRPPQIADFSGPSRVLKAVHTRFGRGGTAIKPANC